MEPRTQTQGEDTDLQSLASGIRMSLNLNDAAMAGNVEEVLIRLNMGEDVNQKCYPRSVKGLRTKSQILIPKV